MCHFTVCLRGEAWSQGEIKFPAFFPPPRRKGQKVWIDSCFPFTFIFWDPRKAVSLGLGGQAGLATARFLSAAPLTPADLSIGMLLAVPVTPYSTSYSSTRLPRGLFSSTITGINGPITLLYFTDEGGHSREIEGNGTRRTRAR